MVPRLHSTGTFSARKVPRSTVEKRFKDQIKEELQRILVRDSAREAISSKGLKVLQLASVDDVELPEIDGSPAKFTATVVTQPEFELPEYKGLTVHMLPADVTDAEGASSAPSPLDSPAARATAEGDRFECARCGCAIEVRTPSSIRPHQLKEFGCQCGQKMRLREG